MIGKLIEIIFFCRRINYFDHFAVRIFKVSAAHFCQEKNFILSFPFLISSDLSFLLLESSDNFSANSPGFLGSKYRQASPPISGKLEVKEEMTGQSKLIASSIGIPNPS